MYSFNFDYIFNAVYNALLAVRYAVLFWILRVSPADYLEDHKFDAWDGLRDRGWIKIVENSSSPVSDNVSTIYLGSTSNDLSLSWWDIFKEKVFGIESDRASVLLSGDSPNYGINPNDVNYAIDKVNNDPWFSSLHLSIQNPILAFFADILSVATFFVLLIFIYVVIRWSLIALAPAFKPKEKKSTTKNTEVKKEIEIKILSPKSEDISMPAGIAGLPIDESSLSEKDIYDIKLTKEKLNSDINKSEEKEINTLLLTYQNKNYIPKKENLHIKINYNNETQKDMSSEKDLIDLAKASNEQERDRVESYINKWNIVINYMEGKEEALWRIGILEADNLLFDILTDRGYSGLTIADKLREANFNTIDLAWSAHKIRNRIAHHGSQFVLSERIARNTLELYRSIFTEFKIFE